MIEKIRMKNFMCFENAEFNFSPGVNAIIGANDQGKSTILAALGWVVFGKPAGDSVVRWGSKGATTVEVTFADGVRVSRHRDKNTNWYLIEKGDERQEFRAMGNSVPPDVTEVLGLADINFQGQANNLYPMQLTPGELGAAVNEHCHLEEIHTTMRRVSAEHRAWGKEKEAQTLRMQEANAKVVELEWVRWAQGMLSGAQALEQAGRQLAGQANATRIKVDALQGTTARLGPLKKKIKMVGEDIENARELYNIITAGDYRAEQIEAGAQSLAHTLEVLEEARRVTRVKKKITTARELYQKIIEVNEKKVGISGIISLYERAKKQMREARHVVINTRLEIREIRASLPEVCPLCGRSG